VLHSYRLRAGFARLKDSPLPEFLPARLERSAVGEPIAIACSRGSILSADGVIELPETLPRVEPGIMVEYFPFGEVGG
jgi:molybdopterin molybdotransferase